MVSKSNLPQWFNIDDYKKPLTMFDWAYEVWVRSHYFNHASFFIKKSGFHYKESLSKPHFGLPPTISNFEEFCRDKEIFKDIFTAEVMLWDAEKERAAIKVWDSTEILDQGRMDRLPKLIDKGDVDLLIDQWCENERPISVNLEMPDQELIRFFKSYLKECRDVEKEFAASSKNLQERISKWAESKLLAQFDLLLWRAMNKEKLTFREIAEGIWGSLTYTDKEQNMRKKAIKLFEQTISIETAKALYRYSKRKL